MLWGGGIAVLLEIARGFHPAYGASLLMVTFSLGAAAVGGWIYQLQRDHVRALLVRRTPWTSSQKPMAPAAPAADAIIVQTQLTTTSRDRDELALSCP